MSTSIYPTETPAGGPPASVALAWRTCLGGWKPLAPITLPANAAGPLGPGPWLATTWTPHLQPTTLAAYASRGNLPTILEADATLDQLLPPAVSDASRRAGSRFLQRFSHTTGDKAWRALLAAHAKDSTPGHISVLIATRAALFHFGPSQALALTLAVEADAAGISLTSPHFDRLLAAIPSAMDTTPFLRAA